MIITSVTTTSLRYRRETPMADALNFIPERQSLLVHVHTDEGLTGVGESAYFGGPIDSTRTVIEAELTPLLIGEDATAVERIWSKMFHRSMQHGRRGLLLAAMSGIDIALWDIKGKLLNAPIYELLGTYRTCLPAYASGGFYMSGQSPEVLADEAQSYIERGFKGVKIKVGRSPSVPLNPLALIDDGFCFHTFSEDMERVRAVRDRIGSEFQLMVDANSGWDVGTALRALRILSELNVTWLEEPLFPEDVAGSARLVEAGLVPIAGYETVQSRFGFADLVNGRAVDIVQPDVTWSGGITECRRIAAFASCHNLACVPHSFGSAIALAANAHLLASLPNGLILEVDQTPNALRDELLEQTLRVKPDGHITVPSGPGLGVQLNEDTIARYRIPAS
jgi:L-alanine-DL-glutamate epimerase-like enolase superfamily enzyme